VAVSDRRHGRGPAIDGGTVYAHSNGQLVAVDATTGAETWRLAVGGVWSSPAVANGTVYVGGNGLLFEGGLFAVDAAAGALRWQMKQAGSVFASPAISGGMAYFGSNDSAVYAVSGTDAGFGSSVDGGYISPIVLSANVDDQGYPVDPAASFPAATAELNPAFNFIGRVDGTVLHVSWLLDGAVLAERDGVWDHGATGHALEHIAANAGGLPSGHYTMVLSLGGTEI
jgi:hypothetical protein